MKLIFINDLGVNYKGEFSYEFIFSKELNNEIKGEGWDSMPAFGYPEPPLLKYIDGVGVLKNTKIELDLLKDCDFASYYDGIDGIHAVGWESHDSYMENFKRRFPRLVFSYGEGIESVKDKLYERDILLTYEEVQQNIRD